MIDVNHLGTYFDSHFHKTAFRLELLPAYSVDTDGPDYQRWLDGEAEPTWERKNSFLDILRDDTAAGKVRSRVKVMSAQPTEYERYACEWGYALNAEAGEQINILDLAMTPLPPELAAVSDFWLLDDLHVLRMIYDDVGRFVGGEVDADALPYRRAMTVALAAAESFGPWWARRLDLRRPGGAR